jgi:hypothetical protein
MTAVAGCLLVALIVEHRGDTLPPVPSGAGPTTQSETPVSVPDRDGSPVDDHQRQVPGVERKPGFRPDADASGTLTVRSPSTGDAGRLIAQFADGRGFEPSGERRFPPGSFGPPLGPDPPRRPRSYVEHRRMLLEELGCLGETSPQGPFRHPPTGV